MYPGKVGVHMADTFVVRSGVRAIGGGLNGPPVKGLSRVVARPEFGRRERNTKREQRALQWLADQLMGRE